VTDAQLGFGRMLHAYHLAVGHINLPWEVVLDWHLEGNGWGKLLLLNRLAGELEGYSLEDLISLIDDGFSLSRIRLAFVITERFAFDFELVFERLVQRPTSPAQVMLFFLVAHETGLSFEALDTLVNAGYSLPKIRQAYRLAGGDLEIMMQILEMGISAYHKSQTTEQDAGNPNKEDQNARTAAKIAAQYGVSVQVVEGIFLGACQQNWSCVRAHFRDQVEKPNGN
jgi:hypothetical protein